MLPEASAGRKVVVDAGAAIKLQRLDKFGGELLTTSGVIGEVKDERARAMLETLPVPVKIRNPPTADIAFTKQFAKATGDLGFLSGNDIELIALTVFLHREAGGVVRDQPAILNVGEGKYLSDWAPPKVEQAKPATDLGIALTPLEAADHLGGAADKSVEQVMSEIQTADAEKADDEDDGEGEWQEAPRGKRQPARHQNPPAAVPAAAPVAAAPPAAAPAAENGPSAAAGDVRQEPEEAAGAAENPKDQDGEEEEEEEDDDEQDGSSAGEWVTPDNFERFGMGASTLSENELVTCATADYSVQNVLLQMGITPLTFDGYAVRNVKLWGLICRACFAFSRDTSKVFCPKCGNDTLQRVPIIVGEDGVPVAANSGRKMKLKGSVFSIPKPQGGRQTGPIFAEDEMLMGGRDRELRHAQRQLEKERSAADPFNLDNGARAWYQRGPTGGSRGGNPARVVAGYGRRNPNANNFKHKGSKKR